MRGVPPVDLERVKQEVYRELFARLDTVFPEFGFRRKGSKWQASNRAHTKSLPGNPRPERVESSERAPWGFIIHGGEFVPWLRYVNGGATPSGDQFWTKLRTLADLAGVPIPDRQLTPEQRQQWEARERRQALFQSFFFLAQAALREGSHPAAKAATAYLIKKRGFTEHELERLELGVYTSVEEITERLRTIGFSHEDLAESGLVTNAEGKPLRSWEGRIVGPWRNRYAEIQTFFARDISGKADESFKYLYLRGAEKGKLPPFGLDEALRTDAGHENLVLVEGLIDVIALQARGFTNVAAIGGAGSLMTQERWEQLAALGVRSVTLALDNDEAGLEGLRTAVRHSAQAEPSPAVYVLDPFSYGNAKDPDEFLRLHHGDVKPFQKLLERRIHGYRFLAMQMVAQHKATRGWTDATLKACLDEAIAFDASISNPERFTDIDMFFWPPVLDGTGASWETLYARREAMREREAQERARRELEGLVNEVRSALAADNLAVARRLLRQGAERLQNEERRQNTESVRSVAEELTAHEERLERWRGCEFLGLPQRTIPRLDRALLGLRGLMLLAAMPNVGKTALAVQLGTDVVENNPDACFLFVSLEMSRWEILSRIKCRLARMSWKTLVFGNAPPGHQRGRGREVFFTPDELHRLHLAEEKLKNFGQRIRILDERNFPQPTAEKVLQQLQDLKERTGTKRGFILIDYLQVWPVPEHLSSTIRTDLDADKWRIGIMKTLRDATEGQDAIMTISEARKPSENTAWGSSLADVMGSARGTYTPDVVFLFQAHEDADLARALGMGEAPRNAPQKLKEWQEKLASHKRRLQEQGLAPTRLIIAKGRDGVMRDTIDLSFHFRESWFEEGLSALPMHRPARGASRDEEDD